MTLPHIGNNALMLLENVLRNQVDFLIKRKKKKDKRRNTVTEGDTKEIKEVLHNIINDEKHHSGRNNTIKSFQTISDKNEIDCSPEIQNENDSVKKNGHDEKNNNSSDSNCFEDSNYLNTVKMCNGSHQQSKTTCDKNGGIKLDLNKNSDCAPKVSFSNKKKSKSNIPISTVSAAMSVAVEMRQHDDNRSEDQSSSGNWSCSSDHNSSDSEHKSRSRENSEFVSSAHANTLLTEHYIDYKNRLKSKRSVSSYLERKTSVKENKSVEETTSSCDSSEVDTRPLRDDISSNAPSTESDAFYISSDESDEELSDTIFSQKTYWSSTSLSTLSDGSLNSLLSQTGTELTSSSGTLTSIGLERLPTPPPPPPSVTAATTRKEVLIEVVPKSTTSDESIVTKNDKNHSNQNISPKSTRKSKSMHKMPKSKAEKLDQQKHSVQSSKNIFTSLVNMKSPVKDQYKPKQKDYQFNKLHEDQVLAPFDMYGNSSPKKLKQIPAFIKDNISPVIENESKSLLQSFCSVQETNVQHESSRTCNNSNVDRKLNDTIVSKGNAEIPLKYVHQVTVTPVQRCIINEASGISGKQIPVKESHYEKQICDGKTKFNFYPNSTVTENVHVYPSVQAKFQRPTVLQSEKTKLAARVVLDPEGRVIYSTNSLDRKHTDVRPVKHIKLKSCEPLSSDSEDAYHKHNSFHIQNHFHHANAIPECMETKFQNCKMTNTLHSPPTVSNLNFRQDAASMGQFYPVCNYLHKNQNHMQILPPNSVKVTQRHCASDSCELFRPNYHRTLEQNPETILRINCKETANNSLLNEKMNSLTPDPNVSGLPVNETLLTQRNVHLHSKHMEMLSRIPQNSCFTDSQQNSFSPLSPEMNYKVLENQNTKSPLSTMSTEDLFTVIHNCKKKMNIKTDSDISLASSSRSSSPSYIRPASSKGGLAETGFLSPRNLSANCDNMRERRSWADFRPTNSSSDRKSLACDRLGPAKPTSMHDFKMLLLQTRSNSQVPGPRKSAVEMLKIPVSYENSQRMNSMPLSLSPRNSISFSVQNSPTSETCFYSGHSTVPFKRGNRARASLQSRYTMYPPIFEDCLEDSENCRDLMPPSSNKDLIPAESVKGSNQYRNNAHNTLETSTVNHARQWV
ncbi:uncharacterized protein LOC118202414 isoform X2 [Stegodyphus dumicola]|uniref:uncharacterized protein LOC118202414 isoform X2 n=1 Tax=Stegodyphus dumicola TaxID=202533 RepID=UPI0015B34EF0|nr:uncharacterized protein LOC118202414 isoform X2 [Stegodyphus dumicola]